MASPGARKGRRINWPFLEKRMPGRSRKAMDTMISRLGLSRMKPWGTRENMILRSDWGVVSKQTLKERLAGRTWSAICSQATKLDLGKVAPGMVALWTLIRDPLWGYGPAETRAIIAMGKIKMRRFGYRGKKIRRTYYVDRDAMVAAAYAWEANRTGKERISEAARRLRVHTVMIRAWLTNEGLMPPIVPGKKVVFLGTPEFYDQLVTKYRAHPLPVCPLLKWKSKPRQCSTAIPLQAAQ